jgi:MoaA/NifB/PqqE/SkfB family radical SAM enzyme
MYPSDEEKSCGNPNAQQQKTLQIHPTLKCNLFCKHCYSSSGPNVVDINLDIETLRIVISDANRLGYRVVSFSGGEPLFYKGLIELLAYAKSLGMTTTVTTNGTFIDSKTIQKLKSYLDVLALSIDGPPNIHNDIRGSKSAFDNLLSSINLVKDSGIKFGLIYTLTRKNWEYLLWAADFASKNRASLLQIHPLELEGRAFFTMKSEAADDDLLARVYLLTLALKSKYSNSMKIQYDAANIYDISNNPELIYASDLEVDWSKVELADLLNFLVVQADGSVVPIAYGFSKQYELCNIKRTRLSEIWPDYLHNGSYKKFRDLCKRAFILIQAQTELPYFNWYEYLVKKSNEY